MTDDINANSVAKRKREEERLGFVRQYVLNAVRANTTVSPPGLVLEAQAAWDAIEATREQKP